MYQKRPPKVDLGSAIDGRSVWSLPMNVGNHASDVEAR